MFGRDKRESGEKEGDLGLGRGKERFLLKQGGEVVEGGKGRRVVR